MSLTKASYSLINGAPINVLDYGADSTGANDSSSSIQAAFTASEKGRVYFPAGTYKCNITVGSDIEIVGAGRQKTFFIANNTASPIITFNETNTSTYYFIGGQDFSINGQSSALTGIQIGKGTTLGTVTYGYLNRVEVYNCTNNVILKNTVVFNIDDLYSYSATGSAFVVDDTDVPNDTVTCLQVSNSQFRLSAYGLNLRNGSVMQFQNCVIENNTHYGVNVFRDTAVGAREIYFDTCWFEGNGTAGVGTYSDASSIFIDANSSLEPNSGNYYPLSLQFKNCFIGSDPNAYNVYLSRSSDDVLFDYCTFNQSTGVMVSGESATPSVNKLYYPITAGGTGLAYATLRECSTTTSRPNPALYASMPLTNNGTSTTLQGYKYQFWYQGYLVTNVRTPGFLANLAIGSDITNVSGNGAEYTTASLFGTSSSTLVFNDTGGFSSSTGLFTAQSAGTYQFNVLWPITNFSSAMSAANVKIYQNSTAYVVSYNKIANFSSGDLQTFGGTITLRLAAGDTVKSSITITGGAGNTASVYRGASVFMLSGTMV